MQDSLERLVDAWHSQSLHIQNGCAEPEIKAFETKYKVTLPSDLRDYLRQINGMSEYWPGDQDEEGFSFWPLTRIKTLDEEIEAQGNSHWKLGGQNSLFRFCDYLTWCWAYAIKIVRDGGKAEGVYLVCCSAPIKIAESFSDFVQLYLKKSDKLYPPADHKHI